jgi:hypothetical protein
LAPERCYGPSAPRDNFNAFEKAASVSHVHAMACSDNTARAYEVAGPNRLPPISHVYNKLANAAPRFQLCVTNGESFILAAYRFLTIEKVRLYWCKVIARGIDRPHLFRLVFRVDREKSKTFFGFT